MSVTGLEQTTQESLVDPERTVRWHREQLAKTRLNPGAEGLAAYQWDEGDQSFARGWIKPDKQPGFGDLGAYLEGAAVTMIHTNTKEQANLNRNDRKIIFIQMGWGESDLTGLGFGVDLAEAIAAFDLQGAVDIVLLPQPGSLDTYKDGANLDELGFEDEYRQIEALAKRVLALNGLGEEAVLAVVGHSKGGRYAKEIKRRGVFPQAAYAYLAPVIIGDEYEGERPRWIEEVTKEEGKHVLLQGNNVAAMMVRMVLAWPEQLWRQRGLQALSKTGIPQAIARYFVGASAKYAAQAVEGIMEEIMYDPRALKVQNRVLASMPPFMDDNEQGSASEIIIPGGNRERTLSHRLQQRAAQRLATTQNRQEHAGLVEHTTESPHNLDENAIEAWKAWMVMQVVGRMGGVYRGGQKQRETPDQAIAASQGLLDAHKDRFPSG